MAWEYSQEAWVASLRQTDYARRAAGLELSALADEDGYVQRDFVPKRASFAVLVAALRELRLLETLPHGRIKLVMNSSPVTVTVRKAA